MYLPAKKACIKGKYPVTVSFTSKKANMEHYGVFTAKQFPVLYLQRNEMLSVEASPSATLVVHYVLNFLS